MANINYCFYDCISMRIPLTPPLYSNLMEEILNESSHTRIRDILSARISPEPNGNYYHWDKLRYLNTATDGFSHKEWWLGIKLARNALYQELPHKSKNGEPFVFAETNSMRRLLHKE